MNFDEYQDAGNPKEHACMGCGNDWGRPCDDDCPTNEEGPVHTEEVVGTFEDYNIIREYVTTLPHFPEYMWLDGSQAFDLGTKGGRFLHRVFLAGLGVGIKEGWIKK